MTGAPLVLIVDDEPPIRRLLRTSLTAQGYAHAEAATGAEALARIARATGPTWCMLDLGLPDMRRAGGHPHASAPPRRCRSSCCPRASDERGKVEALDLGADDYVTKPFGMDELTGAAARRAAPPACSRKGALPVFRSGDLAVDLVRRIVTVRGEEVQTVAARIRHPACCWCAHAGKVLTHRFILSASCGAPGATCSSCGCMCGRSARRSRPTPSGPATS